MYIKYSNQQNKNKLRALALKKSDTSLYDHNKRFKSTFPMHYV